MPVTHGVYECTDEVRRGQGVGCWLINGAIKNATLFHLTTIGFYFGRLGNSFRAIRSAGRAGNHIKARITSTDLGHWTH